MLFVYQANLNDTESALFVLGNEQTKGLCFILTDNGVALSPGLSGLWASFHRVLQGLT